MAELLPWEHTETSSTRSSDWETSCTKRVKKYRDRERERERERSPCPSIYLSYFLEDTRRGREYWDYSAKIMKIYLARLSV